MSAVLALLAGAVLGAAAGWFAARARPRRDPGTYGQDPADRATVTAVRAVDAAADLPPGARVDVLSRLLANRAMERVSLPCMTVLRDVDGGPILVAAVSSGWDVRLIGCVVEPDSWAGKAVTEGVPVVAPRDEPVVWAGAGDRRRPVRGGVAVPIISTSRIEGAVIALGRSAVEPRELVTRLQALVVRFAPVLGPAHAVAVAERKANTDELTGLANRRYLNAVMGGEDAARSALVMLDLDFFKKVNDTFGHPAGDAALKHLAGLLKGELRVGDVAARVGGEEFAVWLPGADLALALEVAERLRAKVAAKPFRCGGQDVPLTVSCGVSACPVPVARAENLVATADSALYRAKREGRNRIVAGTGKAG